MSSNFRKQAEAINSKIQAGQRKELGRVLTQEELDATEVEREEENAKRYADMTPVEAAAAMEKDTAEWEQEVTEAYGPEYLDFAFDEKED